MFMEAGPSIDQVSSVANDSLGNVFIAGTFTSTSINFGTVTLNRSTQASDEMFLVKLDPNGNAIWGRQSNNPSRTGATAVTIKGNNEIYLAGYFQWSSISFGNTTFTKAI
jgi:hypothetical protein